jgi:hypothetical protein
MIRNNLNLLKSQITNSKQNIKNLLKFNGLKIYKNFTITNEEKGKGTFSPINNQKVVDYDNTFDKSTNNRPSSASKIFGLPRHVVDLYIEYPVDINTNLFNRLFKNVNYEVNTQIVVDKGNIFKAFQALILFSYIKVDTFVIIDDEEDLETLLSISESTLKEPAVHVYDSQSMTKMFNYEHRGVCFLNSKKLMENNCLNKLTENLKNKRVFFIFYNIKSWGNFMTFLGNPKIGDLIKLNYFHTLQRENSNSSLLQKFFSKTIQTYILNQSEQKELLLAGIINYGMTVTEDSLALTSFECAKKYIRQNKRVLILCTSQEEKNKILKEIEMNSSFFGQNKKKLINVLLGNEVTDEETSNPFDVLIEAPFVSVSEFINRKLSLFKLEEKKDCVMISLLRPDHAKIMDEHRQSDSLKIKIMNLLSSSFLYNDIIPSCETKITSDLNKNEFYSKVEDFATKFKCNHKGFEYYFENISKNPNLVKKISQIFFEQNFKEFFTQEREDISLLTGEKGFYTVLLRPLSTNQLDERYTITRFLLRHGLIETANYEEKVLRIFNTFDFVFDIPVNKLEELMRKASEAKIHVEHLSERPVVFHHQFSDFLKGKKNVK